MPDSQEEYDSINQRIGRIAGGCVVAVMGVLVAISYFIATAQDRYRTKELRRAAQEAGISVQEQKGYIELGIHETDKLVRANITRERLAYLRDHGLYPGRVQDLCSIPNFNWQLCTDWENAGYGFQTMYNHLRVGSDLELALLMDKEGNPDEDLATLKKHDVFFRQAKHFYKQGKNLQQVLETCAEMVGITGQDKVQTRLGYIDIGFNDLQIPTLVRTNLKPIMCAHILDHLNENELLSRIRNKTLTGEMYDCWLKEGFSYQETALGLNKGLSLTTAIKGREAGRTIEEMVRTEEAPQGTSK